MDQTVALFSWTKRTRRLGIVTCILTLFAGTTARSLAGNGRGNSPESCPPKDEEIIVVNLAHTDRSGIEQPGGQGVELCTP